MSSEDALTNVELGEIGEFKNGANFSQDDYGPGYPIINVKQLYGGRYVDLHGLESLGKQVLKRPEQLFLQPGDILFARSSVKRSGAGQCALVPGGIKETIFSGFIIRFRLNDLSTTNPLFLSYLLQSPEYREIFPRIATGTTISNLSQDALKKILVRLPSKHIQDEVAAILGALDDRITLLRETNATLEAIAQALFKSWFVDFDPVRAKMEGRAPEGMDEATAALFPDSFEESELGLVPKGWHYSTVGEAFILTMGQSPPGDTYNEVGEGLPFYQGRTDFGFRFPSQRVFCNAPTRVAEVGDTLVSVRAPVGDVNMAIEQCCVGRGVASVRHPKGLRGFTFYAMRGLRERFNAFNSEGTVFGAINKKDFQSLLVISPTDSVLDVYEDFTLSIDLRIVENEQLIRTLSNLRDTLLPRLISGQLSLPEAKDQLESTLT